LAESPLSSVARVYAMEPRAGITLSLPVRLIQRLEEFARAYGLTRSAAAAYLITQGLARHAELMAEATRRRLESHEGEAP